jgi:glycosyltransferase involved in cell wall biosynthesis
MSTFKLNQSTIPGVSFVCRVKNEEAVLEKSIMSLSGLKIPFEIIVVLNNCTDQSNAIAMKCQQSIPCIQIHKYDYQLSRAGFENLVTPVDSNHSFASYSNWCFSKAQYQWKFKWDADFIASDELIQFFNDDLHFVQNYPWATVIRLPAVNEDASNAEKYLFNCLESYVKYIFWEVPVFVGEGMVNVELPHKIRHESSLKCLKTYWREKPWFYTSDELEAAELVRKYEIVVSILGAESEGSCRASNPDCDRAFSHILHNEAFWNERGIYLYR